MAPTQTLDQYFALTGYLLYPGVDEKFRGQCVQSVEIKIKDVDGVEPPLYPSAKDYWYRGIPGYVRVTDPQPGDIAVYDAHGVYTDGHIAVVGTNGQVFEQNADPDGSPVQMAFRSNQYLLGYLRKEEQIMFNEGDRHNINFYLYGEDRGLFKSLVGKDWKSAMTALFSEGSEFDYDYKVNAGDVGNINQILGVTNAGDTQKQSWKDTFYHFVANNLPAPAGTPPTALAPGVYQVK